MYRSVGALGLSAGQQVPFTDVTFANGYIHHSDETTTLQITSGNYVADLQCYIAPLEEDLILGVPWFESVETKASGLLR